MRRRQHRCIIQSVTDHQDLSAGGLKCGDMRGLSAGQYSRQVGYAKFGGDRPDRCLAITGKDFDRKADILAAILKLRPALTSRSQRESVRQLEPAVDREIALDSGEVDRRGGVAPLRVNTDQDGLDLIRSPAA